MNSFLQFDPLTLMLAVTVALGAGVVKGMVGFAMPMIMISVLGGFLRPDVALAALIFPTLVTNGMQALRQGPRAAWQSIVRFRVFLLCGLVMMLLSAQMVAVVPQRILLALIGGPVALFAVTQLLGRNLTLPKGANPGIEAGIGAFAGFIGGFSGVWGPPTVAYLTALGTEKREQMRVQGVIYGLGAVALTGAHISSGVISTVTAPLSALLVLPAVLGMWMGGQIQDRIDQAAFRKATLLVLLVAGLNLVRRALL